MGNNKRITFMVHVIADTVRGGLAPAGQTDAPACAAIVPGRLCAVCCQWISPKRYITNS